MVFTGCLGTQSCLGDALTPMCYLSWLCFPAQALESSLLLPALEEALLSASIFHQWGVALCCWWKVGSIGQWVEDRFWKSPLIGGDSPSQALHQMLAPFAVLVYVGCCNKTPQSGRLISKRLFIVLKAGSPRWGCPLQGHRILAISSQSRRSSAESLCEH